jgi:hypothetical protein
MIDDDDDTQVYKDHGNALPIAYQSGYYDGKKAAQRKPTQELEARELASQFGSRMCDENGDTHGEELYCFSLDDIIVIKEALAQPAQERNFCSRCGKRTPDLTTIHTCTPPQENT